LKKSTKNIIGYIIIGLLCLIPFAEIARRDGIVQAIIALGSTLIILGLLILAFYLIGVK
jgi:uncharacterized MnhB-related membrane protein